MNSQNFSIPIGTLINGCEILSEIGSGGMGTVYKALDKNLDRFVAVKVMHSAHKDELAKARLVREASAIASLNHTSIVNVFSYGEYDGHPFFIMEFVEGCSVKDFINRCRTLHFSGLSPEELLDSGYARPHTEGEPYFHGDPVNNPLSNHEYPFLVRRLMISAASALNAAHKKGIIHRDIKSSNILIVNDAEVRLIDFGLVKKKGNADITRTDQFLGTLSYCAPEQLMGSRGEVSSKTDIYSFGVVLYELLTLQHPVSEEDPAAIVSFISQEKPVSPRSLNPHIPVEIDKIVMKCLEKDPEKRFKDGEAIENALRNWKVSSTWFSNFKEMLKGWFLKEEKKKTPGSVSEDLSIRKLQVNKEGQKTIGMTNSSDNSEAVAKRFLKKARKEFYINFAVIEAIEDLKQAYELDPGSANILFMLSFALNAIGNHTEIKDYLDASKKLLKRSSEKDSEKYLLIRDLFWTRNYEEGTKRAIRLKEIYPDDLDFQFALFFSYEATGNYSKAIREGKLLAEILEDNNIMAVALSECYFSVMDFESSKKILKERIANYPDCTNLHLKSIQTLHISGNFVEAEKEVKEVLAKAPQNMLMLLYHARILASSGKFDEAFNAFRKAVSVTGDAGLRASGFYCLYRLKEQMGKAEAAKKHLEQARKLRETSAFLSNEEALKIVNSESLAGIEEEIGDVFWKNKAIEFARKVCFDTLDLRSYTIGNYGCTSILEINDDRTSDWHVIFSNFNLFDGEEVITQLWVPEMPSSPFVDQAGNILSYNFYKSDSPIKGGTASIKLVEPWKPNQGSHIYCKFSLPNHFWNKETEEINYPGITIPACRNHALLIIGPENKDIECDLLPDKTETIQNRKILSFFKYLAAGETLVPKLKVSSKNSVS